MPTDTEQEPSRKEPAAECVALRITVRSNDDRLSVTCVRDDVAQQLAPSSSHKLLLLLARSRIADIHLSAADQGWLTRDEACEALRVDASYLAVAVYRLRCQLGVSIIERRDGAPEMRLGTDRVEIIET